MCGGIHPACSRSSDCPSGSACATDTCCGYPVCIPINQCGNAQSPMLLFEKKSEEVAKVAKVVGEERPRAKYV